MWLSLGSVHGNKTRVRLHKLSQDHTSKSSPFFLRRGRLLPLRIFVSRVDPQMSSRSAATIPKWTTVKAKVGPHGRTRAGLHGEGRRVVTSFFGWNCS